MEPYNTTPPGRDPHLWEIARRRASFKGHLVTYLIMSVFFWVIWFFTGGRTYGSGLPWPVWPMFGWGIGVFFHYMGAYVRPRRDTTEQEYEKLMNERRP